jgi:hypothetical protein
VTGPEQAMNDLRRVIDDYPRRLAELTERASAAAAATITGEDESGLDTVPFLAEDPPEPAAV